MQSHYSTTQPRTYAHVFNQMYYQMNVTCFSIIMRLCIVRGQGIFNQTESCLSRNNLHVFVHSEEPVIDQLF